MTTYNKNFFLMQRDFSYASAKEIVPEVMRILSPSSVVDLGCGTGSWLKAFSEQGIKDISGIDDGELDENLLYIDKKSFLKADISRQLNLRKKFDLAISLEVAEHINLKNEGVYFNNLISLSDKILFSAAIPGQGGDDHVNERWQGYWVDKFEKAGYVAIDYLRHKFWNNKKVNFWYSQNIILFIKNNKNNKKFINKYKEKYPIYSIVHPEMYLINTRMNSLVKNNLIFKTLKKIKYSLY